MFLLTVFFLRGPVVHAQSIEKQLGLETSAEGTVYARRLRSGCISRRTLKAEEADRVAGFLKSIPDGSADEAFAKRILAVLEEKKLQPKDTVWFESDGQKGLKLTDLGRNAVPGIVLGDPFGPADCGGAAKPVSNERPADGVLRAGRFGLDFKAPEAVLADPAAAFDGGRTTRPMPVISMQYGTGPHAITYARDVESIYHLYGYGTDRLLDKAFGRENTGGKRAARIVKGVVLDVPLALAQSFSNHELGHFDWAHMAGVSDVSWTHENGSPLGAVSIGSRQWAAMSERDIMAFNAGGIMATQAASDEMRRRFLAQDQVDWSHLPPWFTNKMDATLYGFITPPPSSNGPGDFDTVQYVERYAKRSGRSPTGVYTGLVAGAAWNLLDPLAITAAYDYAYRYLWKGEERAPNPMWKAGGAEFMVGTGFWLSEVGPQYRAVATIRDPKSKILGQFAPTVADGGQWALDAYLSNLPVTSSTRGRLTGAVWNQRRQAEPGPMRPGGAVGAGVEQKITKHITATVDAGYKTEGSELGLPFDAGPYAQGGVLGSF